MEDNERTMKRFLMLISNIVEDWGEVVKMIMYTSYHITEEKSMVVKFVASEDLASVDSDTVISIWGDDYLGTLLPEYSYLIGTELNLTSEEDLVNFIRLIEVETL